MISRKWLPFSDLPKKRHSPISIGTVKQKRDNSETGEKYPRECLVWLFLI